MVEYKATDIRPKAVLLSKEHGLKELLTESWKGRDYTLKSIYTHSGFGICLLRVTGLH